MFLFSIENLVLGRTRIDSTLVRNSSNSTRRSNVFKRRDQIVLRRFRFSWWLARRHDSKNSFFSSSFFFLSSFRSFKLVHQNSADFPTRSNEMSILRHKCLPMLACHLFRILDLVRENEEIFRLIVFLSDSRKQKLYSVRKKLVFRLSWNFSRFRFSYSRKMHSSRFYR